jgi:hypothetical protein
MNIEDIINEMERASQYERNRSQHSIECCDVERWAKQLREAISVSGRPMHPMRSCIHMMDCTFDKSEACYTGANTCWSSV